MNFKKFLRRYGTRLGAMTLGVVLIVAVSAHFLGGRAGVVSDTAGIVKSPVQSAVGVVVDWFESLYGYMYEYDMLVAENEALRTQLAEAQEDARLGAEARDVNVRMRELLGL